MKFSTTLFALSLAIAVSSHELPSRYFLARRGQQTVGGTCGKDSDCQQGCCGFSTGRCAGPAFAQEAASGAGGCGRGNAKPNCNVSALLKLDDCIKGAQNGDLSDPTIQAAAEFVAKLDGFKFTPNQGGGGATKTTAAKKATGTKKAGSSNNSGSSGTQSISALAAKQSHLSTVFETCKADSDCQQGCCAFSTGKCAGPGIAQTNGDGGCGKGNAKPNCDVASALKLDACVKGAQNGDITSAEVQQAAAFVSILDKLPFTPS
uniref:Uncharacterized protein n=1 Tax=Mycena chlorophos TaxID=658473 RepID=A0ABQ0LP68_MYCCL|nr:predicted protein [Mycena chlorophos]